MGKWNQYILRSVAGVYWLVQVDQHDTNYKAPFMLNEIGAFLWKHICEGYEINELSTMLHDRYEIDINEALTDVQQFYDQLNGIFAI